jgi:hypothetical protein
MRKSFWIVVVAILGAALAVPALAGQGQQGSRGQGQGSGGGKGKRPEAGQEAEEREKAKGKSKEERAKAQKEEEERERAAAEGRALGKDQEKKIRDWFANPSNQQGLPPGLAKREQLPPGLQRHLERNGTLPPGLQKRIQPLPPQLESQLPKTAPGTKRVVVAGNVILLEERTSKILDIVGDVMGGSGREGTTGVRRPQPRD